MTKSTITREQLEEWVAQFDEDGGCDATDRQLEALIRQSLSAMESEPVAWTWHYREQWHVTNDEERARDLAWDGVKVEPLYRRAAMLQAGTLTSEGTKQAWTGIPDIDNAINMLDRIDTLESCDDDRIEAVKTVLRGLAGNSPVIPDGYVMVPKEMTDEIGEAIAMQANCCGGIALDIYDAMLAAAPQPQNSPQNIPEIIPGWIPVSEQKPDCWCLTCRPVTLNDMRFVVCPDCGNKRCLRANDHRNACTGSNEPGQEGSAYPAAPQEVRGE
ncbi:hypothetical protein ACPEF8_27965 [Klebsiella sp. K796]|uniref:hypothetical protein n=1 Tax=Klebsiella sp. K796 TaxID=3369403 RepID=UPI003C2C3923